MKKAVTLDELLKQTDETTTLDLKRLIKLASDNDKYEFAKDVSAFGNTQGGFILYGREDPKEGGKIIGINPETFDADQMQQIITSRCYPPVDFSAKLVRKDSLSFVLLQIPESGLKPHEIISTREVWIRRGGTTDRATQRERYQMSLKKDTTKARRRMSVKERIEMEGIPELPEGWGKRTVIRAGRAYVQRVYGRLDVSLLKEEALLATLGLLCFVPLAYWFYETLSTKTASVPLFSILSVFLALGGVVVIYGLVIVESLRCPHCQRHFGLRRIQHTRIKDREIDRTEEYIKREVTYSNMYACEFCNYKIPKIETQTETIDL
jgi:hypothetical protein